MILITIIDGFSLSSCWKDKVIFNNITINVTINSKVAIVFDIVVVTGSKYWIGSDEWYIRIVKD